MNNHRLVSVHVQYHQVLETYFHEQYCQVGGDIHFYCSFIFLGRVCLLASKESWL